MTPPRSLPVLLALACAGCPAAEAPELAPPDQGSDQGDPAAAADLAAPAGPADLADGAVRSPASLGLVGDPRDVARATEPGVLLGGGGPDVDAAMRWLLGRGGGGDVVVLRATGTDAYNRYLYDLGPADSVETLRVDSRALADDPAVERTVRAAEVLFLAGGDQWNYLRLWRGTRLHAALEDHARRGGPLGGTSAGCAVLGALYFDAAAGTVRSPEALADPYDARVSLGQDFLHVPALARTITDTHYDNPDRRGRHVVFLARALADWGVPARGIGIDEGTAVCVDGAGRARVLGAGAASFLRPEEGPPEECAPRRPLRWVRGGRAVRVYRLAADGRDDRVFDLANFAGGAEGTWQHFTAEAGALRVD